MFPINDSIPCLTSKNLELNVVYYSAKKLIKANTFHNNFAIYLVQ